MSKSKILPARWYIEAQPSYDHRFFLLHGEPLVMDSWGDVPWYSYVVAPRYTGK